MSRLQFLIENFRYFDESVTDLIEIISLRITKVIQIS